MSLLSLLHVTAVFPSNTVSSNLTISDAVVYEHVNELNKAKFGKREKQAVIAPDRLTFFIATHTIKNTNFSFKLECFFLSIILLGPTMFFGTFHLGVCSC